MSTFTLVVFGSCGVGKSSLTLQLVWNRFVDDYDPTIEDSYRKQVTIDGETCLLDILDTANQNEYSSFRDSYMKIGQGYLLIYSLTSRTSFEKISLFQDQMLRIKDGGEVTFILVGNKSDLETERTIPTVEGHELSKSFGCSYIETSAKTKANVEECFYQLVREIRLKAVQNEITKKKKESNKCSLF
eukprot:TRINITY_DN812_c0_g1_i2.p2 TRINITY_DN812_c0_g1~~TRINITY_DN812_c0_g1_i2.p2  ORF type:complete len:187 (-),score=30.88 TRINITY_DN812_c0_g1_i2:659-1219(-)